MQEENRNSKLQRKGIWNTWVLWVGKLAKIKHFLQKTGTGFSSGWWDGENGVVKRWISMPQSIPGGEVVEDDKQHRHQKYKQLGYE